VLGHTGVQPLPIERLLVVRAVQKVSDYMSERKSGTVTLTGVQVLEAYDITHDDEVTRLAASDPDAYLTAVREVLEQNGHEVNGMMRFSASSTERGRVPAGWYHYVYPSQLWSMWVYIER
jgi:hypothetical protein